MATLKNCMKNREKMTRSGAEASTLPTCKLFTQLLFIKDTVLNHPTATNISINDLQQDNVDLFTPPPSPSSSTCVSSFQDTTKRGCTIQESRKRSKTSLETVDKMLLDAFRDEGKKEKTLATDVSFAESIVPLLRALPPRKNRLAKIEIQQVLMKYEFDE